MKGIIVAAGFGTRFLPVTKSVPKEMLPLVDKPSVAFVIEELIASGVRDIVVVTSRRKGAIESYLDRDVELEEVFRKEGSDRKLDLIKPYDASFSFVRQPEMLGTGQALLLARPFIGEEPFVVAYPDDLHFGGTPLTRQLIEVHRQTGCSVLATLHDPPELNRYGILKLAPDGLHVADIVEKPPRGSEPSREASIGRYLYTPELFDLLSAGWAAHRGGEYYHIHALRRLMQEGKVVFKRAEGERLDTGSPEGYLQAIIRYAGADPGYRKVLREAISKELKEERP